MKAFGDQLRQAREAKGVALDSVSRTTRIARRYLQALERNELDALPGAVFAKGYIKAYAEYLQIDAEPVLAAYTDAANPTRGTTPENDGQMLDEMGKLLDSRVPDTRSSHSLGRLAFYAGGVLVLLIGVWWLVLRTTQPEPEAHVELGADEPTTVRRSHAAAPTSATEAVLEAEPAERTTNLRITRSGVGTEILERNLIGRSARFVAGTKLWYWTLVLGGEKGERIVHSWIHDGRTSMRAELSVGGPHWRTYSAFTLPSGSEGQWIVEARNADGQLLARDEFVCIETRDET